eukprot:Hpha_TRINITY_DN15864_c3_g1::TRINITY_DN15864_c3_g1_i1::g.192066::m.192066
MLIWRQMVGTVVFHHLEGGGEEQKTSTWALAFFQLTLRIGSPVLHLGSDCGAPRLLVVEVLFGRQKCGSFQFRNLFLEQSIRTLKLGQPAAQRFLNCAEMVYVIRHPLFKRRFPPVCHFQALSGFVNSPARVLEFGVPRGTRHTNLEVEGAVVEGLDVGTAGKGVEKVTGLGAVFLEDSEVPLVLRERIFPPVLFYVAPRSLGSGIVEETLQRPEHIESGVCVLQQPLQPIKMRLQSQPHGINLPPSVILLLRQLHPLRHQSLPLLPQRLQQLQVLPRLGESLVHRLRVVLEEAVVLVHPPFAVRLPFPTQAVHFVELEGEFVNVLIHIKLESILPPNPFLQCPDRFMLEVDKTLGKCFSVTLGPVDLGFSSVAQSEKVVQPRYYRLVVRVSRHEVLGTPSFVAGCL